MLYLLYGNIDEDFSIVTYSLGEFMADYVKADRSIV